jgi:CRP-like cAMP-binding protein
MVGQSSSDPALDPVRYLLTSCIGNCELQTFAIALSRGDLFSRAGLLFITEGKMELALQAGSEMTVVAVVGSGDVVGLPNVLNDDAPSVIRSRAISPVSGYFVPMHLVRRAVQKDPTSLTCVSRLLSARVNEALACLRAKRGAN